MVQKLALACDELFSEYFDAQTQKLYHSFQIIREVEDLTGIIPNLSVSALLKLGSKRIVLLLIEEKLLLDKVDNSSKQIAKHGQEIPKENYAFIYCIVFAQKTKEYCLVKFAQPNKDIRSPDEFIEYSRVYPLINPDTSKPDLELMKTLFRVALKAIYVQLEKLDMLDMQAVKKKKTQGEQEDL